MKTIWAFDLGKASLGEAVRQGDNFLHKASLLIPEDFAETKTAAARRRMWRTRLAHKAREAWLVKVSRECGLEVLNGRNYDAKGQWQPGHPADPRLEREFAAPGDPTCYTSCLLRIRLLRGEKLEPWQAYKALHSAIQRRGYDPNIPWKNRPNRKAKPGDPEDDAAGTKARMDQFEKELHAMAPDQPDSHYPCYFDAWKMGLWNPKSPALLNDRIDCQAESTRNQVVPRKIVEAEIRALVDSAARHYPKLKGKADYLLYGPSGTAYASHHPALRKKYDLKEGGDNDWQGVLGQKIPRFDNRIIAKCVLIPRLNVCKIRTDESGDLHPRSRLAAEVSFLMKLKNMRFQRNRKQDSLTAPEIASIFANPAFQNLAISTTAWKKKICVPLLAVPLPGHESVEAPKASGRSRFCRPALDILKRLILSGQPPKEFHRQELHRLNGNTDPLKGLVESDLKFLLQMGENWEGIYIPNQKLDALVRNAEDPASAIRTLIGTQNDPIVRHRLSVFAQRIAWMASEFDEPDTIVLEFVREDFMGRKAKLEYSKFIKDRAAERAKARQEAAEVGATASAAGFKLELLKSQKAICLYTGDPLVPTSLDQYCIDHIVPRAKNGPDAAVNYVLTTRTTNDAKADRTPFEWLSASSGWDAYVSRVRERIGSLRNKKVQLLISPDAETLVQKYTALAETAWISKLAQAILDLQFGWLNGNDSQGSKRVVIVSGGLTARIRRQYGLNRILNPNAENEEEAEKKNRDDDRHHALDAMVISYLPGWLRDPRKQSFFRLPEGIHREFFAKHIQEVIPANLCFEKPALAETIYGSRGEGEAKTIVQRAEVLSLAQKPIAPSKTKFDLDYARKQIQSIRDSRIRELLAVFVAEEPSEQAWIQFCGSFALPRKEGGQGSPVKFVTVDVGEAAEYKDLSKDGTGAYRKGLKGHKGQVVYLDQFGKLSVDPIYAHGSVAKTKSKIDEAGGKSKFIEFFQSGCAVGTAHPIPAGSYSLVILNEEKKKRRIAPAQPLPPSQLTLRTIITKAMVAEMTLANSSRVVAKLDVWIQAGLYRI